MKGKVCPFLGLKDDSDTALAYPSPANHCFRSNPPIAIKLDHQREFCLSGNHRLCGLFQGKPWDSKTRGKNVLRRSRRLRRWFRNLFLWLFPSLFVLASLIGLVLIEPVEDPIVSSRSSSKIPPTLMIGLTQTPALTTPTPSPSFPTIGTPPTILVSHMLEVPIGTQTPLVIHKVKEGESLALMAKTYNTTEEAIASLNYNLSLPLWRDRVIVIPLNQVEVNNLPQFEAVEVLKSLSLQDLVYLVACDIELLRIYNQVDPGYIFKTGDWVLIPHIRMATLTR
jgi:hypothetical protein